MLSTNINRIIALLLCVGLLSSCFQVLEEVTLKNDGSGQMQLTLNFSQSRSKLASIMLMDSLNGHKIPTEKDIREFMNETVDYLKKSKGISNVRQSLDLKNYIATVNFHFQDLANINGLTKKLLEKEKNKAPVNSYVFEKASSQVKRIYQYSPAMKKEYDKLKPKDREVFKTAGFTSIFRFDKTITASSNKAATISPSGKAIMIKTTALGLIFGTANISNNIQLNK
ncbi:MAG: hypothetical protein EOO03_00965 [Chitinophagaceae bacterium]|nr:MAG: hypothetical protein EOO03_00965 [Chitinophagaceae bacterium]